MTNISFIAAKEFGARRLSVCCPCCDMDAHFCCYFYYCSLVNLCIGYEHGARCKFIGLYTASERTYRATELARNRSTPRCAVQSFTLKIAAVSNEHLCLFASVPSDRRTRTIIAYISSRRAQKRVLQYTTRSQAVARIADRRSASQQTLIVAKL